jgi:bile acid:Na+ symporter, BASS family
MAGFSKNTITSLFIFLAILLGFLLPPVPGIAQSLPYILSLILFFSFAKIDINPRSFLKKELLVYPPLIYLFFPAVLFFVTRSLDADLRMGLILIAVTPTAISSPVVADLINSDRALNIAGVVLTNLLAPLVYSAVMIVLFSSRGVSVPVLAVIRDIALVIIVPMVMSALIKKNNAAHSLMSRAGHYFNAPAFPVVIFAAVGSAAAKLKTYAWGDLAVIGALTMALSLLLFVSGALLVNKKSRGAMALVFGHKNTALAVWVGLSNFNPGVTVPVVIYIICHHIINSLLILKAGRSGSSPDWEE